MPVCGVVCGYDGSFQSFDTCIHSHDNYCERNCHAPVELLHIMKNNQHDRRGAGWSATTLTSCPRAVALLEVYDYYEPLLGGWNKGRGTWYHMMLDSVPSPDWVMKEERVYREVEVNGRKVRVTGRPDKVDKKYGVLTDGKSKEKLPKVKDLNHEAQLNIYVWLVADGTLLSSGEHISVPINKGGMHYATWRTKEGQVWLKMGYPLWELSETETFVKQRLIPLVEWRDTGNLPRCDPYVKGRWDCDCVKITKQLEQRGIEVSEQHEIRK